MSNRKRLVAATAVAGQVKGSETMQDPQAVAKFLLGEVCRVDGLRRGGKPRTRLRGPFQSTAGVALSMTDLRFS